MPGPGTDFKARESQRRVRLSRLLALVLRHRPDEVGLSLDAGGFVPLDDVARALAAQPGWESLTVADLIGVAEADPRRYEVRDGRPGAADPTARAPLHHARAGPRGRAAACAGCRCRGGLRAAGERGGIEFRRAGPALYLSGRVPPEFLLLPD